MIGHFWTHADNQISWHVVIYCHIYCTVYLYSFYSLGRCYKTWIWLESALFFLPPKLKPANLRLANQLCQQILASTDLGASEKWDISPVMAIK